VADAGVIAAGVPVSTGTAVEFAGATGGVGRQAAISSAAPQAKTASLRGPMPIIVVLSCGRRLFLAQLELRVDDLDLGPVVLDPADDVLELRVEVPAFVGDGDDRQPG
jgi:hypothetical protein